jgi:hypothetical protein
MDKELLNTVRVVVAQVAGIPLERVKPETAVTQCFRERVFLSLGVSFTGEFARRPRMRVLDIANVVISSRAARG